MINNSVGFKIISSNSLIFCNSLNFLKGKFLLIFSNTPFNFQHSNVILYSMCFNRNFINFKSIII